MSNTRNHQNSTATIAYSPPLYWDIFTPIFGNYPFRLTSQYTPDEILNFINKFKPVFKKFPSEDMILFYGLDQINNISTGFSFYQEALQLSKEERSIEFLNHKEYLEIYHAATKETLLHIACRFIWSQLIPKEIAQLMILHALQLNQITKFLQADYKNRTILYWAVKIENYELYANIRKIFKDEIFSAAKMVNTDNNNLPIEEMDLDFYLSIENFSNKKKIYSDLVEITTKMDKHIRPLTEINSLSNILNSHKEILVKNPALIDLILEAYAAIRFAKSIINRSGTHLAELNEDQIHTDINEMRKLFSNANLVETIKILRDEKVGNCQEFSYLVQYYLLSKKILAKFHGLEPGDHAVVVHSTNPNQYILIDGLAGDIFIGSIDEVISKIFDFKYLKNLLTNVEYKILVPTVPGYHKLKELSVTIPNELPLDNFSEVNQMDLEKDRVCADVFRKQYIHSFSNSAFSTFKKVPKSTQLDPQSKQSTILN